MKRIARVFVHGEPKAQPRPRAFVRGGRAAVYDPGTAEGWKGAIASAFKPWAGKCIADPVAVMITFFFPRPKSHFGTGRNSAKLKPSAPQHHTRKPDADNAAKAVLDALSEGSGIGLWKDDTQVIELIIMKAWAEGSAAGATIEINYAS